jgi:hypothetical protein
MCPIIRGNMVPRDANDCYISLTECNSGTTQKIPLDIGIIIELKYETTTSDNIGTLVSCNIPTKIPVLSDVFSLLF